MQRKKCKERKSRKCKEHIYGKFDAQFSCLFTKDWKGRGGEGRGGKDWVIKVRTGEEENQGNAKKGIERIGKERRVKK